MSRRRRLYLRFPMFPIFSAFLTMVFIHIQGLPSIKTSISAVVYQDLYLSASHLCLLHRYRSSCSANPLRKSKQSSFSTLYKSRDSRIWLKFSLPLIFPQSFNLTSMHYCSYDPVKLELKKESWDGMLPCA